MRMLLKMDLPSELTDRLRSVLHYNGLPIDARSVTDDILVQEGKKERAARSESLPVSRRERESSGSARLQASGSRLRGLRLKTPEPEAETRSQKPEA